MPAAEQELMHFKLHPILLVPSIQWNCSLIASYGAIITASLPTAVIIIFVHSRDV